MVRTRCLGVFLTGLVLMGCQSLAYGQMKASQPGASASLQLHWPVVPDNFLRFSLDKRPFKELRSSFITGSVRYPCTGSVPVLQPQMLQAQSSEQQHIYTGEISGKGQHKERCQGQYTLTLREDTKGVQHLNLTFPPRFQHVRMRFSKENVPHYGLGEQFAEPQLTGHYPMIVQEGGIGKGQQPLSFLFEMVSPGSSGHRSSTYFPHPVLWSATGKTLHLQGTDLAQFELQDHIDLEVSAHNVSLKLFQEPQPLKLIEKLTTLSGRQPLLPDAIHRGAIVGIQGGSEKVSRIYERFRQMQTPLAGFWLQDWVGRRRTAIGSQLWWNWEINTTHYPQWQSFKQQLAQNNMNVMGYINPFLVDAPNARHNYYREALKKGYLIKNEQGVAYPVKNTDFSAGLLDLSHPEVGPWIKGIIRKEMIETAGFKAWMADYAEALPLDAVLHTGEAESWHNRYPVEWARLNAEAIQEAGCTDCAFFMRSGYNGSTAYTPLFWEGDQLVTWDKYDGLASSVRGLLSSGLSGIALNHSDAGGYTSVAQPIIGGFTRSPELLKRWLETNMFTAILRTHEGNQPELNAQIYSNDDQLRFFDRCARIYATLFDYRKTLFQEAHARGWPVVRHMLLHYPADVQAHKTEDQFMLGSELLIAPVLTPEAQTREVYLPAGKWVHLWSGKTLGHSTQNQRLRIPAPLGYPPVFYPQGSAVGAALRAQLLKQKLIDPNQIKIQ